MHMPIQMQIKELHGYDQPLQFFREHPGIAYEMCMRTEEKLTMAYIILSKGMDDMAKHTEELIKSHKQAMEAKDCVIQGKDDLIGAKIEKYDAEQRELKSSLARANNEILKLAQNLSIRGMIEKIECQFSDKRRTQGSLATRHAVWSEILGNNEDIKRAVIDTCTGRNVASKVNMAIEIIVEIYRRASNEIHHAGYTEIPVRLSAYQGQELNVLRNLCAATHYVIMEVP